MTFTPDPTIHERITEDPEHCTLHQLLTVLLSTNEEKAEPLARRILKEFEGLSGLRRATVDELASVTGVSRLQATRVKAAVEFGTRLAQPEHVPQRLVTSARDVYEMMAPRLQHLNKERFLAILLNGKNRIMRVVEISRGSLTASVVHPREAFLPAVKSSAASVIFVHNHPSGDSTPSHEDQSITDQLRQAGRILGISMLDHVIVGNGDYCSMAESGRL